MTALLTPDDIARRFPRVTLAQAWAEAQETEHWVFDEVVSSSITTIYGPSNVGKSFVVSSLLLSLKVDGRLFFGMEPLDPGKVWRPAILCTDPGSPREYGERLYPHGPEDETLDIPLLEIGLTRTPEEWEALADHLIEDGRNFIVLDNLNGATGDYNDAPAATVVYDGLNRLVRRGATAVVLHHETGKHRTARGADPMGTPVPVQKSRAWIQVRQTGKRKLRGGNTGLYVQGNGLPQHMEIIAQPLTGPDYRVLSHGPAPEKVTDDLSTDSTGRAKSTLDTRAEGARWVVEHCQGMNIGKAAEALAEHTGRPPGSCRKDIQGGGRWSDLLSHTGKTWSLANP